MRITDMVITTKPGSNPACGIRKYCGTEVAAERLEGPVRLIMNLSQHDNRDIDKFHHKIQKTCLYPRVFKQYELFIEVIRHPYPYGDLARMRKFAYDYVHKTGDGNHWILDDDHIDILRLTQGRKGWYAPKETLSIEQIAYIMRRTKEITPKGEIGGIQSWSRWTLCNSMWNTTGCIYPDPNSGWHDDEDRFARMLDAKQNFHVVDRNVFVKHECRYNKREGIPNKTLGKGRPKSDLHKASISRGLHKSWELKHEQAALMEYAYKDERSTQERIR